MKSIVKPKISHADFLEKSVSISSTMLRAGSVFGIIVELFNISRIFIFTNVKLGTINNRIYFSFYLTYLVVCIIFLIFDFYCHFSLKIRYRIYMASTGFCLCWHTLFNIYDIYRADAIGYFTITTAVFFSSGLLMMKPAYTLSSLSICYIIFVLYLNYKFSSGEVLNFSFVFFLCVAIYLVRYKHLCVEISQAKLLQDVQQELTDVQRDFRLTVEQYELIREKESSVTFEWNIKNDWIRFSKEWKHYFDQPEDIPNFYQYIDNLKQLSEENRAMLLNCMENIRKGMVYQKFELVLPTKATRNGWFELCVIAQKDEQGEPILGIGMLSDITDRKEKINQLEKEIQMDLFTGLLNKAAIERYGKRKLSKLQEGELLAALILDMDDFKDINDCYGHPVGDYVLKKVAGIMVESAPVGVRIGRIGGDEFMALFLSDDLEVFKSYARDLICKVSKIQWKEKDISVGCSIGLAAASSSEKTYEELYRETDDALYKAKRNGKKQLYCAQWQETARRNVKLTNNYMMDNNE